MREAVVGMLAPTGLSLQGVPLRRIQTPPASDGRGAERIFFDLEQPWTRCRAAARHLASRRACAFDPGSAAHPALPNGHGSPATTAGQASSGTRRTSPPRGRSTSPPGRRRPSSAQPGRPDADRRLRPEAHENESIRGRLVTPKDPRHDDDRLATDLAIRYPAGNLCSRHQGKGLSHAISHSVSRHSARDRDSWLRRRASQIRQRHARDADLGGGHEDGRHCGRRSEYRLRPLDRSGGQRRLAVGRPAEKRLGRAEPGHGAGRGRRLLLRPHQSQ